MDNKESYLETEPSPSKPPLFASWNGWYGLVVGLLIFQIVLYSILTEIYK